MSTDLLTRARRAAHPAAAGEPPSLFDLAPGSRAGDPPRTSVVATAAAASARPATRRARPRPLALEDDHPEAEARFDVLFTHEQMVALNGASAAIYARLGHRVNKSQLLRALVACLRAAGPALAATLEGPTPILTLKPPAKAASAEVHRRFEAQLAALLSAALRA